MYRNYSKEEKKAYSARVNAKRKATQDGSKPFFAFSLLLDTADHRRVLLLAQREGMFAAPFYRALIKLGLRTYDSIVTMNSLPPVKDEDGPPS